MKMPAENLLLIRLIKVGFRGKVVCSFPVSNIGWDFSKRTTNLLVKAKVGSHELE